MKALNHRSAPFLGFYLMVLLPVLFIWFYFGKGQVHLFINHYHSPFFDHFFYWITKLGEPLIACTVIVGLLFFKYRYSLILGLNIGICALTVSILKAIVINDMRPFKFFQYFNAPLHFVEGVRLHEYNTFPSGHTTLAFSFFFLLSVFCKKPWLSIVFFVLALLVGYSRMYLSMHFLADVWVGSILGISIAISVYQLVTHHRWFTSKAWWDGKLLKNK
ncbi:phosphatase PAP2 family protein [Lewinella cohaerens]|uniref:phosphatase PAP2 family protein n=1 Tax=Lewinella cohaerens TaxID=70995 RepID=UPI00035EEF0E|nr:phosphatase PAP2 family protein [Lewinella cohaerens]